MEKPNTGTVHQREIKRGSLSAQNIQSPVSLWSKFIQGKLNPLHFCISSFSSLGSCSGGKAYDLAFQLNLERVRESSQVF